MSSAPPATPSPSGRGTSPLVRLDALLASLERLGADIAGASIFVIMVIVFADVFLRYLLHAPLSWSYDLISLYLVPLLFFMVISETFRQNHHVAVDIFYLRFSETGRRVARVCIAALMIPIVLVMADLALEDAVTAFRNKEVLSGAILWPTWIPLSFVVVGFGLLLVRLVLDAVALALALVLRRPAVSGESTGRQVATNPEVTP